MRYIFFEKENAPCDEVTWEVFSTFFKDLFQLESAGVNSNVPYSLNPDESSYLGKLICHTFLQSIFFFPVGFAKLLLGM